MIADTLSLVGKSYERTSYLPDGSIRVDPTSGLATPATVTVRNSTTKASSVKIGNVVTTKSASARHLVQIVRPTFTTSGDFAGNVVVNATITHPVAVGVDTDTVAKLSIAQMCEFFTLLGITVSDLKDGTTGEVLRGSN